MEANSLGLSEAQPLQTREEGMNAMLAGNLLLLVEGYDKGLKIGSKGYPARSVDNTDTEKVLRGSNEGFTESVKTNTALIRKRIRSTDMKVEELTAGVRSNTRLVLVYMKELVYPEVLEQIRRGIDQFVIDGVLDSGIIEQLNRGGLGSHRFHSFRLPNDRILLRWKYWMEELLCCVTIHR